MLDKETIQNKMNELKQEYGEWTYDIPLPFDIWTRGNLQVPHTRLRRVVQMVHDLVGKPLNKCRVLDLGCLDGIFSIEFALHGAQTVGVEIREANVRKAVFCKEVLGLDNLEFRQDDARNISVANYGKFDAIICSGLLYHLTALDAIKLVNTMFEMTNRIVVIDTHVSLVSEERFQYEGTEYWGDTYQEYPDNISAEVKAKLLWSSADNPTSFWFTRPSLVNIMSKAGFSSVFECFYPVHLIPERGDYTQAGITSQDRCTFVAIKNNVSEIQTSPITNSGRPMWTENSLSYAPVTTPFFKKMLAKFKNP